MVFKVAIPGKLQFKLYRRESGLLLSRQGDVHYIGGSEVLPPPLEVEKENEVISDLGTEYEDEAKSILIEHNLRLVVYIAKKFDNTGVGVEDLISIGTIGLIKSINTFNPEKNIKLETIRHPIVITATLMVKITTSPSRGLRMNISCSLRICQSKLNTSMECTTNIHKE